MSFGNKKGLVAYMASGVMILVPEEVKKSVFTTPGLMLCNEKEIIHHSIVKEIRLLILGAPVPAFSNLQLGIWWYCVSPKRR
jgi:hypothetical protein